jgi:hypothetical protein
MPTTGEWTRKRCFIFDDFSKSFDDWSNTGDSLIFAPAGFTTSPGFTPGFPVQYINNPHRCTRKIVEVKLYTPFDISLRVSGNHLLVDIFWCVAQPFITAEVLLVAEIPANQQPTLTQESLSEAFAKVGVKYLSEWNVRRRYGKLSTKV